MIIIPEIETVVILVPRTGSGSLRRAIAETYPKSMLIYRHMEADGLPLGYDRWRKVGVVRHPLSRLWSLYKFLQVPYFGGDGRRWRADDQAFIDAMRKSVTVPFDRWVIENQVPFTTPYDTSGNERFYPQFSVRHPLPENRKSQEVYLRPDLGTEIFHYHTQQKLYDSLNLQEAKVRHNVTDSSAIPLICNEAQNHMDRFFRWDYQMWSLGR